MKSEISKETCLILASVCAAIWSFDCAGTNWQGFSPQEAALRLIPVHGFRDPGGVVYYPDRGTLFLVGDHGDIAELRADGKILRRKHCGGDLEGIAYDPRTGLLYLAVEGVDEIWECDPGNFEVKRRFKIDRAYRGDSDFLKAGGQGIEGIAFIPDSRHPEGGHILHCEPNGSPCSG